MADANLDDFFAKKDKTKKKSKAKYTANDILAQQETETKSKKTGAKKKKAKDKLSKENPQAKSNSKEDKKAEDEEWADFQEEEEADYSGLRIKELQISKEEEEERENTEGDDDIEDDGSGEKSTKKSTVQGPWNIQNAPQPIKEPEPVKSEPEPIKEPVKDDTPAKPAKYIPPAARQAALLPKSIAPQRGRKKNAPNIQSEEDFPTLGGAGPDPEFERNRGTYEQVRGGHRQSDDHKQSVKLQLGNKFDALSTD